MLKLAMLILWPSFLVAIVAEGFFFSLFDPADLLLVGGFVDVPAIAIYTVGFFFFWSFGALAAMLSLYLYRDDDFQPPF
ncbi:MAG: hypothetical protein WBJ21_03405 [Burkholderiaceae bacterium]|jgi:hypothetical protein